MKRLIIYFFLFSPILFFYSCDLQQEVDLNLPEFEPGVVVESYLEPGNPYFAILVESVSYLGSSEISFVRNAEVNIRYKGENIQLIPFSIPVDIELPTNGLIDTSLLRSLTPIIGDSLHFYASLDIVPEDFEENFILNIKTETGQELTASTLIPRPIAIDTMEYRFDDEDSLAFVLTKWQDPADEVNFYRRVLDKTLVIEEFDEDGNVVDTLIDSEEIQDFIIDDDIENGQLITIGTDFEFERGDTLTATTFHISQEYYRFIETSDAAFVANLSPFGQPTLIESNIEGGTGVFAGFTRAIKVLVIPE
ncbi:MAG: DUF4249 domain-containing protein [Bacteroidota bacterium]